MRNIFSGLRNFRPLTPDLARKIHLLPGLIYRSDALDKITHEDTIRLTAMGIRTIIDLRSPEEIDRHPDKSVPGVEKIFNFPIGNNPEKLSERGFDPDVYTKIRRLFIEGDFAAAGSVLSEESIDLASLRETRYREFVTAFGASVGSTLAVLMDKSKYPVVIHCQGGKDRTGFVVAIIELILGYDEEDVVRDYLVTNAYNYDKLVKQCVEAAGAFNSFRYIYSAHRSQIVASLREMSKSYGSVDGYVKRGLGITPEGLEQIRHNLLETRRA